MAGGDKYGRIYREAQNNPHSAMQANRHDAAEKCADIAVEVETCTMFHNSPPIR